MPVMTEKGDTRDTHREGLRALSTPPSTVLSRNYMKPSPPQFLHRIVFKPEHALQRA
jgi:hypothetical protein